VTGPSRTKFLAAPLSDIEGKMVVDTLKHHHDTLTKTLKNTDTTHGFLMCNKFWALYYLSISM